MSSTILSLMTGPFSPSPHTTPTQCRSSRAAKKKNNQSSSSISLKTRVAMSVAPDMAHVSTHNLYTQWRYMTEELVAEQHRAENMARLLARMTADHDAGQVMSPRGFKRKLVLVQGNIHKSTAQQNVMMARVNQLALEIRHRQFIYEEQQSRMCTPHAAFFQNPFGSPATPSSSPIMYQAYAPMGQVLSPVACQPQPISLDKVVALSEMAEAEEETERHDSKMEAICEHTPSLLQSEDSWDSMVEQELEERQALAATATPTSVSLSSISCPTSPGILAIDGTETDLALAAVNDALTKQKRRQSLCILSATDNLTL